MDRSQTIAEIIEDQPDTVVYDDPLWLELARTDAAIMAGPDIVSDVQAYYAQAWYAEACLAEADKEEAADDEQIAAIMAGQERRTH